MSRLRRVALAGSAVVIGIAAALALAEGALRLFPPDWLAYRMRVVDVGAQSVAFGNDSQFLVEHRGGHFYRFKPGSVFPVRNVEYDTTATIDEFGGRVVPARNGMVAGDGDLVPVLGDSLTFGLGVEDGETFVNLLAERLDLPLINLGVPGWSPPEELDILENRHEELGRPNRYIIVFAILNDFEDMLTGAQRRAAQASGKPVAASPAGFPMRALYGINNLVADSPFLRGLYIVQLAKIATLHLVNKDRLPMGAPIFRLFEAKKSYVTAATEALHKQVRRLAAIIRRKRLKVIFIVLPSRYQIEDDARVQRARYYGIEVAPGAVFLPNAIVSAELSAAGIPFIDITTCLSRHVDEGLFFVQDPHFTPHGHAVVAECAAPELARSGWHGPTAPGAEEQ